MRLDPATTLSEHLTWGEAIATQVRDPEIVLQQGDPPAQVRANLLRAAVDGFEPFRALVGPLRVNSGYRCWALNAVIGGSKNSAHIDGRAFDVFPTRFDMRDAFKRLVGSGVPFDQAIYEYGRWIHLGMARHGEEPRREKLMIFRAGQYEPWDPSDPRVRGVEAIV